jgi:hypothetical protein
VLLTAIDRLFGVLELRNRLARTCKRPGFQGVAGVATALVQVAFLSVSGVLFIAAKLLYNSAQDLFPFQLLSNS